MAYGYLSSESSFTVQHLIDVAQTFGDLEPILNVGGQTNTIAISCANSVMNAICAANFPWKWNEFNLLPIYSNSFQQDYAGVTLSGVTGNLILTSVSQVSASQGTAVYNGTITGGAFGAYIGVPFVITGFTNSGNNGTFMCVASSAGALVLQNTAAVLETHAGNAISAAGGLRNLAWLQRGIGFDINNTSQPKPWTRIEVGRQLPQQTAQYTGNAALGDPGFFACWFPNRSLYYGVWGAAQTGNSTIGNNPVAGSVYTNPLGTISQPFNPLTQIQDANGNFLLLTTYGTEGSTAPLAAVNACPGTTVSGSGATTQWTVLDPNGWGLRLLPVPSQAGTQWEWNVTAQMKPVRFVDVQQTLAPIPDEFEPVFRDGFITQLYRRSPDRNVSQKFSREWQLWLQSLTSFREREDRELEENKFIPTRTIFGASRSRNNFQGAAWPFNYPRP